MFNNKPLLTALALSIGASVKGMADPQGLSAFAADQTKIVVRRRGWFVMLTMGLCGGIHPFTWRTR